MLVGITLPSLVWASAMLDKVKKVSTDSYNTANTDANSLSSFAGTIVNIALTSLGVIFVILIIVAGFMWMTSSGDKEKIDKATKMISASVIGLLIVVAAYALWNFIQIILF